MNVPRLSKLDLSYAILIAKGEFKRSELVEFAPIYPQAFFQGLGDKGLFGKRRLSFSRHGDVSYFSLLLESCKTSEGL